MPNIRYIRQAGGMPDASRSLLMGRAAAAPSLGPAIGPNARAAMHPAPPPMAPQIAQAPAAPPMAGAPGAANSLIPWLLMAGIHSLMGKDHLKEGEKQTGIPSPVENKFYTKHSIAPKIALPGTTTPNSAKAPHAEKSPGPAGDSESMPGSNDGMGKSPELPHTQTPEKVSNPPIIPTGVEPISRQADNMGREASSEVNRSAELRAADRNKATALVNPAARMYEKKQLAQYVLKRPRG